MNEGRIKITPTATVANPRPTPQAWNYRFGRRTAREYMVARGDGSLYDLEIFYDAGTDKFEDTVRFICNKQATLSCDEVVPLVCELPIGGGLLGTIRGRVDMLGHDENPTYRYTSIRATRGPLENQRWDKLTSTPASGEFLLPNLMPSDAVSPPVGYWVWSEMFFGKGHRAQFLRTPFLWPWNDSAVMVEAGKTTDLADTFVMDPGYVTGDILLAGPPPDENGARLAALYRDADRDLNGDGIPDYDYLGGSVVAAYGSSLKATGATLSTYGGYTRVGFAGAYDAESHDFVGDYRLTLGGLKSERSLWRPSSMSVQLVQRDTPNVPGSYLYSHLTITDLAMGNREIVPGETTEQDRAYCMSDVDLSFRSSSGTFYNPRTRAFGRFAGTDFQGNEAAYIGSLRYAYGTPTTPQTAASEGLVRMSLPEGSYTITPTVSAVNPGGGWSNTQLLPIEIEVGCRQTVVLTTELQLDLDEISACTDVSTLAGSVRSDGNVNRIFYTHNDGAPVDLCTNCGEDPTFSAELSMDRCTDDVSVTALDEFRNEASVSTRLQDDVAPVLSQCDDITAEAAFGALGAKVHFDVGVSDSCQVGPQVVCDADSGDFFGLGETTVTCHAVDRCENRSSCSFVVEVVAGEDPGGNACESDQQAPIVECSVGKRLLWPPNHKWSNIGFQVSATDGCDAAETGPGSTQQSLITEVWSDETEVPERGDGSGMFAPDASLGDGSVRLRRERRGTEDGRVYLLISDAEDAAGNQGFACCTAAVPHDQSRASRRSVLRQADAALAYCEAYGIAPASFTQHGISKVIKPKPKRHTRKWKKAKKNKKKARKRKKKRKSRRARRR